ncbi:arginyl-tRNA--protein transferase 1-like isoform X2 [Culicoides brevitarsis]|uniref:arginyl-tRNA--protein transferase 1-like isoform X2 n=1 Tax=Culicoides brevitarsis TaxID=469753 RepID=UPI00307B9C78
MMQQRFSIVEYYGEGPGHRCGYCKSSSTSLSHGMWSHILTAQDYQDLINRGWRRSGKYCYKPNNKRTCCPLYTIKCDAINFKLSKTHKKILKRMNKFLRDGSKNVQDEDKNAEKRQDTEREDNADGHEMFMQPNKAPVTLCSMNEITEMDCGDVPVEVSKTTTQKSEVTPSKNQQEINATKGPDPNKPICKKAKELRLERKMAKLAEKGLTMPEVTGNGVKANQEKTLEQFLAEEPVGANAKHKLKLKLIPSSKGVTEQALDLYKKYQITIHNDSPSKLSEAGFRRFLCESPIKIQKDADAPPMGYGSFHQQYWLDNRLIAVAVIDILPQCVSSVYFFYDPDFSFLSLGTYASLREIALTRELQATTSSLSNYYMGFYIHSCPKMRYKGKLYPSYLLCPETYTWHLLDDAIRKRLDVEKYQRFNPNADATDPEALQQNDILLTKVLYGRNIMHYGTYVDHAEKDESEEVREYGNLIGRSCSRRIVLFRG